jgi:hypothetical protein
MWNDPGAGPIQGLLTLARDLCTTYFSLVDIIYRNKDLVPQKTTLAAVVR